MINRTDTETETLEYFSTYLMFYREESRWDTRDSALASCYQHETWEPQLMHWFTERTNAILLPFIAPCALGRSCNLFQTLGSFFKRKLAVLRWLEKVLVSSH